MSVFTLKSRIRINCAARLVPYLKQEVEALEYTVLAETETGVEISGTLEDCMTLNLHLRTAFRVLFEVETFTANNAEELYKALVDIPWEEWIDADGYVSITSYVFNDSINDTRFANLRVKDAIVDRIGKIKGRRPDSGPATDKTVVYLFWKNENAAIYFDTSGETIAKHGYRKIPFKAPMQESLASAVLLAAGWPQPTHFLNPMCGSGTLAIEAALMALNKAPGLTSHNFGFMHILGYDEGIWKKLVKEATMQISLKLPFKIIATDIDPRAIQAAKINAREAGVYDFIQFRECDFKDTPMPDGGGIVMMNPAYGERMGEVEALESLYAAIGDFFKQKCAGYMGYVFTGNPDLAKKIGLKPKRRIPFYNSKIDCRLISFELYGGTKRTVFKKPSEE